MERVEVPRPGSKFSGAGTLVARQGLSSQEVQQVLLTALVGTRAVRLGTPRDGSPLRVRSLSSAAVNAMMSAAT